MNNLNQHTWGIILAADDRRRLQTSMQSCYTLPYPMQYCPYTGFRSMLLHTIDRAEMEIAPERLLTVVNRSHLQFAEPQLAERPGVRMITEPCNRETGPAVLHGLLHVQRQDPEAVVCLFPSDHFVLEEDRFMDYVRGAAESVTQHSQGPLLLGVQPSFAAEGYGWIEKGKRISDGGPGEIYRIERFIEKPDLRRAYTLYLTRSLWDTQVVVGKVQTLLGLFERYTPFLYAEFTKIEDSIGTSEEADLFESLYLRIDPLDFASEVLKMNPKELRVLEVKNVYWSNWGVPERLESDLRTFFPWAVRTLEDERHKAEQKQN